MKKLVSLISPLAVVFLLYIFTFYMDGEIGVILTAFVLIAPIVSLIFALYARNRIKVSFDCDGYVKKNSKLTVRVTVEKEGRFPLGIVQIDTYSSEVFAQDKKIFRLSVAGADKKTFTYEVSAVTGGNGEIAVKSVYSCGFLGFVRFRVKNEPLPKSVGVIPEIPQIKSSSKLFRSIADSVLTSDDEENNDSAVIFSANTTPGYEHREYVQGDPLKRINWKLSTKKNRLMVRLDEAVASVQPVIALDLYRSGNAKPEEAVITEEKLISSVFGLVSLLINQGIACTFIYYGAGGELISESVDNPEYPPQLLLKVLASKVIPERRIRIQNTSACACVIASTDCGDEIAGIISTLEDKDNASLIGVSAESRNLTDLPMWYLDGDNNFKQV
ncbi:MAG: DUF58 domain-containing protein [Ruminococcus flavefaciens]|nr:DUF58 domain-containing protein [Ruminococcus flavefaciens]MCM1230468.1 DUF58 domain-containing protein [Ruminococcus flavefaciens]